MASDSELEVFRGQASARQRSMTWVSDGIQDSVLSGLLSDAVLARAATLRPVVCIDLDLTTLLAPDKSREVLQQLASTTSGLPVPPHCADMIPLLAAIWRGEQSALLPGYTTTAIAGYGAFMAACLEARSGLVLGDARDACEAWITSAVHGLLRNGYWDRDAACDAFSPGFADFAKQLIEVGGTIVFLSNRAPALRETSINSLAGLLDGTAPLFAFFGPGGSAFDASSKAVAIELIEQGVGSGVHFGRSDGNRTVFDAQPEPGAGQDVAVVAVIDDRAENRRQVVAAAATSSKRLGDRGLRLPRPIACAAPPFCPEIEIVASPDSIGSFVMGIPQ